MFDIKSMTPEELTELLKDMGEPAFRAKQIFQWLHQKGAGSYAEMTNLSKKLRESLSQKCELFGASLLEQRASQQDGTVKYLFQLNNGSIIESVLMKYSYGSTVCVSTQAGCKMGCAFCASTLEGLERNLTPGEILSQIYEIQKASGEKIGGVVLMGSGEPLDNYDNVLRFIQLINHPQGLNIGQRHITVSTCGLTDKIYSLAEEMLQITLAVSLHAPNDEIRRRLMPISKKYPMEELLRSCKYYSDTTKRRITFEYALVKGINDSVSNARELADNLRNMLCHVNLIPINDVKERGFEKPSKETVAAFEETLQMKGIETTVRRKLGSDINAACGQLRRGYMKRNS